MEMHKKMEEKAALGSEKEREREKREIERVRERERERKKKVSKKEIKTLRGES
jgi:hypothetical protein